MSPNDDTTTFADFQNHLRDHIDHSKSTGRPLHITTNGQPEAVVLSPTAFDELMDQAELARSPTLLDRRADDIRAGRITPAKAAIRTIADELNLKRNR